jgi:hypothetical protein
MAKQTIVTVTDDLDGTEPAETVTFGLDGREYEIDLSDENTDKLHDALAPYIEAGRKAGSNGSSGVGHGRKPNKPEPGGRDAVTKEEAQEIRAWVRTEGGHIGDRGRIPKKYVEAFRKDPKDTSVIHKDDEPDQPEPQADTNEQAQEEPQPVGAGDPFSTFTNQENTW